MNRSECRSDGGKSCQLEEVQKAELPKVPIGLWRASACSPSATARVWQVSAQRRNLPLVRKLMNEKGPRSATARRRVTSYSDFVGGASIIL